MRGTQLFIGSALILAVAAAAFAQAEPKTKTVTNADLEKYRQARLAAEKDLRENYEALGFPSPEELDRRNVESNRELADLAQRLRERDRRLAERQRIYYPPATTQNAPVYPYPNPSFVDYGGRYAPAYLYYQYYYPGYGRRAYRYPGLPPTGYPRYPTTTRRDGPPRFQTFRRMLRNARH